MGGDGLISVPQAENASYDDGAQDGLLPLIGFDAAQNTWQTVAKTSDNATVAFQTLEFSRSAAACPKGGALPFPKNRGVPCRTPLASAHAGARSLKSSKCGAHGSECEALLRLAWAMQNELFKGLVRSLQETVSIFCRAVGHKALNEAGLENVVWASKHLFSDEVDVDNCAQAVVNAARRLADSRQGATMTKEASVRNLQSAISGSKNFKHALEATEARNIVPANETPRKGEKARRGSALNSNVADEDSDDDLPWDTMNASGADEVLDELYDSMQKTLAAENESAKNIGYYSSTSFKSISESKRQSSMRSVEDATGAENPMSRR